MDELSKFLHSVWLLRVLCIGYYYHKTSTAVYPVPRYFFHGKYRGRNFEYRPSLPCMRSDLATPETHFYTYVLNSNKMSDFQLEVIETAHVAKTGENSSVGQMSYRPLGYMPSSLTHGRARGIGSCTFDRECMSPSKVWRITTERQKWEEARPMWLWEV